MLVQLGFFRGCDVYWARPVFVHAVWRVLSINCVFVSTSLIYIALCKPAVYLYGRFINIPI